MSAEVQDLANKNARGHRKVKEQVEDFHQMAELNQQTASHAQLPVVFLS